MADYEDLFEESAAPDPAAADEEREEVPPPSSRCPRWMYHRPDVYCHTCGKMGSKKDKGVSLQMDLPPGGNVKSDWKKGKK